jgi:uncharacterized flavoprotein (TIGR03862 family)
MTAPASQPRIAIVGGGPSGLMAAEVLGRAGVHVDLYDAMPSVGRKFLLAGVGGMNITHSEPLPAFLSRYAERRDEVAAVLDGFGPDELREWIHGLGIETFVGSSGRVFPADMKAAPLLRAWLKRLRELGVQIHTRSRWLGWGADGSLRIANANGEEQSIQADAVLLALGGGSWARLGSDGAWTELLTQRGVALAPLRPSNCGFEVEGWSEVFRQRFAGAPVKSTAIALGLEQSHEKPRAGEFVVTETGVEGSLIYALSARTRQRIEQTGSATLKLDLLPHKSVEQIVNTLDKPRAGKSLSNHLRARLNLDGVRAGLLRELAADCLDDNRKLAQAIKTLPLTLVRARPLDEAISSAGGVPFEQLDERLMLRELPGVFCAGEMLDWEAPTGGYLLTACFASGRAAGLGVLGWLARKTSTMP